MSQSPFSDLPNELFRPYLGQAHLRACEQTIQWMMEAGMKASLDSAGNVVGRFEGTSANAPALIIGSHLDSVRNAGAFDGPLGVMLGIECIADLFGRGRRFPFAIEVIAFGDEEGSRFPASMLCSRAFAGQLQRADLEVVDVDGVTLKEALVAIESSPEEFLGVRRASNSLVGYLEAHIEQGPELESMGLALGCVTGIAGQLRIECEVEGVAGHAGTNSMVLRKDALSGTAEAILHAERIANQYSRLAKASRAPSLLATVGKIEAHPNLPNVVPGKVRFTLDVRSLDMGSRNRAAAEILSAMEQSVVTRGLRFHSNVVHDLGACLSDPRMVSRLEASLRKTNHEIHHLPSGAGHDAMAMAAITPMTMLFIRCEGGISHNPRENVEPADVQSALDAMIAFVEGH